MIQRDLRYDHAFRSCCDRVLDHTVHQVLLLLRQSRRNPTEDMDLRRSALAAWELVRSSPVPEARVRVGMLLARLHASWGEYDDAVRMARQSARLGRSTGEPVAVTIRALRLQGVAYGAMGLHEQADHVITLARVLVETIRDPAQRCLLAQVAHGSGPCVRPTEIDPC